MRSRLRLVLMGSLLLAVGCSAASSGPDAVAPETWRPPGAEPHPAELLGRLAGALEAKGPNYVPRTRHVLDRGAPKYNNRLILESSPYLLQHAHNPVNWYPWGDEAFETARRLGRPVLLSIGYSTCHWCHVMEEESFEDEEIAAYLNANYVAIKVDREERPDLDAIYMSAVQMLTGRGGWPMTTWLTPDREPFYGGTYFPARDGDRGSRVGFLTLLGRLKQQYDEQPEQVVAEATKLVRQIGRQMQARGSGSIPGHEAIDSAVALYARNFDTVHGGMKRAPKFPSSLPVRLLLRHYRRTGEENSLHMATFSLRKMAAGGMYDQVGGGFHRYSTDGQWLVPHFEKMLYDNALLTMGYLEAYQVTGEEEFARIAREVLDYVSREMTAPGGGFYSATDADSLAPSGEREEGWFFTWTMPEIEAVVDAEVAEALRLFYGVTPRGNYEGRNILHRRRTVAQVAAPMKIPPDELAERLARGRKALYEERSVRPAPLRDDKILTSWNGLMVSAFAQGGFILDRPEYVASAARAARFALDLRDERGRLFRSYNVGEARHAAFLDDYAFLTAGLLDLYEASSDIQWLDEAIALQNVLDRHYGAGSSGGYFMTSDDHESLLAREKPNRDGAEPSGNSIALLNLLRLHELTTRDGYRKSAEKLLAGFGADLSRRPTSVSELMLGLDFWNDAAKEVVIVTRRNRKKAQPFLDVLRKTYLPNKVVVVVSEGDSAKEHSRRVPWIEGKVARRGKTTAYVCEQGICQLPTADIAVFAEQLVGREGQSFDE